MNTVASILREFHITTSLSRLPDCRILFNPCSLAAVLFAQLFEQVLTRMQATSSRFEGSADGQQVHSRFEGLYLADGSTLEAIAQPLHLLQAQAQRLGGKMMMMVEATSRRPVAAWYSANDKASEQPWNDDLLERLPIGALLIFDLVSSILSGLMPLANQASTLSPVGESKQQLPW